LVEKGKISIKEEVRKSIEDEDAMEYLNAVIATIPEEDNPTLLEQFNYKYENGKLVNSLIGTPFHWVNQSHYDALGDVITLHIQEILRSTFSLKEVFLPLDVDGPKTNIFLSENFQSCENILVLVQGSGAVRAGQWARALCINDNLNIGTVFPYVEKAINLNYGVIILNPNDNSRIERNVLRSSFLTQSKTQPHYLSEEQIPILSSPYKHVKYVWETFVETSDASSIAIVAHSAGGPNTISLLQGKQDFFQDKVKCIAFTDSVHGLDSFDPVTEYLQTHSQNWVTSSEPLDTPLGIHQGVPSVSAGHQKHEYTSGYAIEGVFRFIQSKLD